MNELFSPAALASQVQWHKLDYLGSEIIKDRWSYLDFDIFMSQKTYYHGWLFGVFEKVGLIVWGSENIAWHEHPFPKVKEFLPLDGWFFDASEDHQYFEAMNLEGQQILSEGFPVRSFTITWEQGMPRLKLDFQSCILSQEKFFLHTWSFFALCNPSTTYLGKRPQQKIGVQFVFLVSLTFTADMPHG